jgi:hypothetical protein
MLLHGWVQAVDCTSFQAKMSSQNSGHGCLNLVMRERTYAETRMWNMWQFIWRALHSDDYFCVPSLSGWREFPATGAADDSPAKLFCVTGSTWESLPQIHHRR